MDMTGAFDQIDATLRDLVPILYAYKQRLEKQGFSPTESIQLVIAFQSLLLFGPKK